MLEIPESNTIARQLNETIRGKKIKSMEAGHTPHGFAFYFDDPGHYPDLLQGQVIGESRAWAGQIEISAGNCGIVLNDGINIRYYKEGSKHPVKHQLALLFEDGSGIFCTISMYGGIAAFPQGLYTNPYYLTAKEKPSPLSEAFDEAYFENLFAQAKPNLSAKALLATEQRIPGLGNGVLQDVLFYANIHPKRKIGTLTSEEKRRLFHSVKDTLGKMCRLGGRDTEKDLFGKPGGYHSILSKKTLAYPCSVCGAGLVREAYLGGNVYFCPICQPLAF